MMNLVTGSVWSDELVDWEIHLSQVLNIRYRTSKLTEKYIVISILTLI